MSYKIGAIIFLVINLSIFISVKAQYNYSIDIGERKTRRVSVKYRITQTKQTISTNLEIRKKKRVAKKVSKVTSRHAYSIQTNEVKRRMRKSKKRAENNNKGKVPLYVKLKTFTDG